jgi:quercetin dioxygenase-like cupin family protein
MKDFPEFIKNATNKIATNSQNTDGVEGYVFSGAEGSQIAYWTYSKNGQLAAHVHEYDQYMVLVQGEYTLIINGKRISLKAGQEYLIKKGTSHGGEAAAGTRVIDAFGGKRVKRVGEN